MKQITNEEEKGNKIITEFLTGYRLENRSTRFFKKIPNIPLKSMSKKELALFNNYSIDKYNSIGYVINKESLKFHSSWDWLILVIEKVYNQLPDYLSFEALYVSSTTLKHHVFSNNIKEAFKDVVSLIKYINTVNEKK